MVLYKRSGHDGKHHPTAQWRFVYNFNSVYKKYLIPKKVQM